MLISFIPYCLDGFSPIEAEVSAVHLFDFAAAYVIMTVFYNGKKGKHPVFSKWFFYIFYPAHVLVIALLKWLWL